VAAGAPVTAALARALTLLERSDPPAALDLLLGVLAADPLCTEARLLAGIAYHLAGDALEAAAALRAALALAPDLWPAELYLGLALDKLGDEAGSVRALRRAAALAAAARTLPLSPVVAGWLEAWRVDAIAMGRGAPGRSA
jgi:tetratricopeptide (TPR) repeat protein